MLKIFKCTKINMIAQNLKDIHYLIKRVCNRVINYKYKISDSTIEQDYFNTLTYNTPVAFSIADLTNN